MTFHNMRDFLQALEAGDQLVRIGEPVSRDLEITEITDRVSKGPAHENKALLFEAVEGFETPLSPSTFLAPADACRLHWALKTWTKSGGGSAISSISGCPPGCGR